MRYQAQVRLKGFPPQNATFTRKTDAKRWIQQTEAAIREGRHFKTTESKRRTLAELIDRYISDVLPTKPKSMNAQGRQLTWWKNELGYRPLADVTPALLSETRDKLHQGRQPATVVRYMAALSHAFTVAVNEWEWLEENPLRKVRKPKEPRGRVRFLSESERQKLLVACKSSNCRQLYPVVVLALSTGMRQSEIMGLKWSDIDLNRGYITLHETKNGERRSVPLVGHAKGLISELAKVRRLDTDLLFFSDSKPTAPIFIRSPWGKALKQAAISDFKFHDLRHTAASYLAMNGASLTEIAEILGHKTLQMVKRYAHLSEQHTSKVLESMNSTIFGVGS
ncbi:tyrosine-type recombinase/integrase [Microbulbifer sp. ANSA003]|uniref:tyrosine-type recombinase/integrase n=1 Tax=Microbulbifer sp. ANSA003 TaxID=3243360 RepID=UPI0040418D9F